MHPVEAGSEFYACYNCDSIQASEYTGADEINGKRNKTVQDQRFTLEWSRRYRRYYPEQYGRSAA
jgi:hypothetical protein